MSVVNVVCIFGIIIGHFRKPERVYDINADDLVVDETNLVGNDSDDDPTYD